MCDLTFHIQRLPEGAMDPLDHVSITQQVSND